MAMSGVTSSVDSARDVLAEAVRPPECERRAIERRQSSRGRRRNAPPAASLTDLVADLDEAASRLAPIEHSLEARAAALGKDLEAAFRFVRDHVRFETYQGILKGPELTYAGLAGNAFDRALLLAELLKRNGVRDALRDWTSRALESGGVVCAHVRAGAAGRRHSAGTGAAGGSRMRNHSRRASGTGRAGITKRSVASRVHTDGQLPVRAAISCSPRSSGTPGSRPTSMARGRIWTQPLRDAEPGRAYAAADQTFEVLPPSAHQLVTVRVVTEVLDDRSLRKDNGARSDRPGARPAGPPDRVVPSVCRRRRARRVALPAALAPDTRVPVLWIDGESHEGKPIDFADQQKPTRGEAPRGGGFKNLFGSGGALSSSSRNSSASGSSSRLHSRTGNGKSRGVRSWIGSVRPAA